jgi:hypothetical protein
MSLLPPLADPGDVARLLDDPRLHVYDASVRLERLSEGGPYVLAGGLPPRALRLVTDWASDHQEELRENWDRARRHEPLRRIEPLR